MSQISRDSCYWMKLISSTRTPRVKKKNGGKRSVRFHMQSICIRGLNLSMESVASTIAERAVIRNSSLAFSYILTILGNFGFSHSRGVVVFCASVSLSFLHPCSVVYIPWLLLSLVGSNSVGASVLNTYHDHNLWTLIIVIRDGDLARPAHGRCQRLALYVRALRPNRLCVFLLAWKGYRPRAIASTKRFPLLIFWIHTCA